ncbi:hypothetical protein [Saccharothrix luteola]|nr:hypothetical protein [Saccharothrix luteola]
MLPSLSSSAARRVDGDLGLEFCDPTTRRDQFGVVGAGGAG